MTAPPSRRSVLRTCVGTLGVGGLAGCLAPSDDSGTNRSERRTETTTETPSETSESPTPRRVEAHLAAENEADTEVALTVTVRRDGERVAEQTATIDADDGRSLAVDVARPGEYTVEARLRSGTSSTFDWEIGTEYDGRLEVRITGPDQVVFREKLRGSVCENGGTNGDLPFSLPDAEETYRPGTVEIRNDAKSAMTLTVSIVHEETTYFECTTDLGGRQFVSNDAVTASAGTYAVTVDVSDGGRTEYSWQVPTEYNWPKLLVVVDEDGDPLVGCGGRSETSLVVENPTNESQSVDLTLLRGEEPVDDGSITVDPDSETEHTLSFPIGDFYTLRAATDAGTGAETLAYCDCYEQFSPTVTLGPDGPQIEPVTYNCE
ncbi:hypothetical protein [Halomicrobium zhouii]|uniref:hypothetical protein n=1 Tax=Halomicrobium zhouii TaxID=767519 RepID=UPI001160AF74|nr:hypothetical protein [Halomicrobium zhouii]